MVDETLFDHCRKWSLLIESPKLCRELIIRDEDVIENADDEVDIPLDSVLKRYNMTFEDLFILGVNEIKLFDTSRDCRELIRSISFEYLRYNLDRPCGEERA